MSNRHEEIARCLFRESNDALFIFDPGSHRVIEANPVALRLTGFERKVLTKKRVWDLFQSPHPATLEQLIEAYRISWFYHSREGLSLNRAEGAPIPVNVRVSRLQTRPDPLGLLVARDISERKQAQEALDRFFRLAPDLFAIVRPEASGPRFVRLNPAWEFRLGYRPDELVGTSPIDLAHADDLPAIRAALDSLLIGRELIGFERRLRHRDGSYRWLDFNAVLADGLIYLVGRDVTEEKRLSALRRAMERTELASRAKSELLRDLGHELRTPTAAILEYADKLVRAEQLIVPEEGDESRLDDLKTIRRNARYLIRLMNDLLDLARLESGTMRVEQTDCRIGEVLAQVLELLGASAQARGLALSLDYRTPIPAMIRTDGLRLRQILINLISNAIKFTTEGSVRVEATLDESIRDQPMLILEVIDTGIGMSPEVVGRLFEPFYRASGSHSEGAGLGLAISQRMAHLLGGRIGVRSESGRGSRFALTIPTGPIDTQERLHEPPGVGLDSEEWSTASLIGASRNAAPEESPAAPTGSQSKSGGQPAADHSSGAESRTARVLLADDHRDLRSALSLRLKRSGYDVVAVEDGRIAVKEAIRARDAGQPFDLILLDLRMPGLGGVAAARQLRSLGFRPPLVVLSASDEAGEVEGGLFDARLVKPIDWERLRRLIEERLHSGGVSLDSDHPGRVQ